MAVKLSRGLAKIEINFDGVDEPEFIYVNPTDTKLLERMKEAQKIIEEKAKAVEPYKLGADGLPEADDAIRYVNETNQIVYDAIDYGFGNKERGLVQISFAVRHRGRGIQCFCGFGSAYARA